MTNGNDFYEEFKDALRYVGLSWNQKDLAEVKIEGDQVCVTYYGRQARIKLSVIKANDDLILVPRTLLTACGVLARQAKAAETLNQVLQLLESKP